MVYELRIAVGTGRRTVPADGAQSAACRRADCCQLDHSSSPLTPAQSLASQQHTAQQLVVVVAVAMMREIDLT